MKDTILYTISLFLIVVVPSSLNYFQSGLKLSEVIALSLLSITAGVFTSFFTKVWETLNARWAVKFADWLDGFLAEIFSGYKGRYKKYLYFRHRDFDVKGLTTQNIFTLELKQVFVDLSVVPAASQDISSNPLPTLPMNLTSGKHSIWEYLKSARKGGGHRLSIIGPPGSGKTTLLKHITLVLCGTYRQRRKANIPNRLPVLLFLREISNQIDEDSDLLLPEIIQTTLKKWDCKAPSRWFKNKLIKGTCLIMLDGLDEVANRETRGKIVMWVERQMKIYPRCDFLITSRPFGYKENPVSGVNTLQVIPFTMTQIRRFVQNWYLANEIMSSQRDDQGVRIKAQEGTEDLLRRINKMPVLLELAVNPLLLTMIATIHRYRSTLPGRRVELYKEICEAFLGKRQEARGMKMDLSPTQKQYILQPLAYEFMVRQIQEIPKTGALELISPPLANVSKESSPEEFLKYIENSSGLFIERESGIYSFSHLTFQEYLASVFVLEAHYETELIQHIENSWWRETIRLYVAQADATAIVEACLSKKPPSMEAISLAMDCSEEARQLSQETRMKLDAFVTKGLENV